MTRLNRAQLIKWVRIVIVLLATSLLPFIFMSPHTNSDCDDPITHWAVPDRAVQTIETKRVTEGLANSHATYGLALTIDANSGQLLSYFRSGPPTRCADRWEPGSITKSLTVATALDTGSITSDFTFYDKGYAVVDNQYIYNWTSFPIGKKNLKTLLGDSLNVGAVAVIQQLKSKQIWHDYLQNHFMLNQDGLGDIAAADGTFGEYRYAVSAFGVGIVTTPLQMSLAYASLVNGGVYHTACFNNHCNIPGKRVLQISTSTTIKQLLTTIYRDSVLSMPSGYDIGGKSGTALLAQPTDEYLTGLDSGTYVGFIEHNGKMYIQLVRLDQPEGYVPASHTARAVWQQIVDDTIKLQ